MKTISSFLVAGNFPVLILIITTSTQPDTETVHTSAQANLLQLLQTAEVLQSLAQKLSEAFEVHIKLSYVREGSIKVDMMLEDLSGLEYIKEMSDKWVLSNIVDNFLITPKFMESCQAKNVVLDVVVDAESYLQLRSHHGEYNNNNMDSLLLKKISVVQGILEYLPLL